VYSPNQAAADAVKAQFLASPQLNWTDIYLNVNVPNAANGSRIVLYEDRTDEKH